MSLSLTASNISKSYNGKVVLTECSYSFNTCGIYILMGPNGSGKSTFLRICALLENPDGGEVKFIDDNTPHSMPLAGDTTPPIPPLARNTTSPSLPLAGGGVRGGVLKNDINLKRRITLVLPKIGVFNTTVFNNVSYGLKIRGLSKGEITDRVHSVLDAVGLTHKKSENALTLSSGETQRLGIARALATEPEILFLDEPTASLDPQNTTIIEELIFRIRKQNSMIIVMVTHNIFQAKRLADQVLFMYEGEIVDHGPKREFFEKPKDERAYRFITGQMVY
jgi:tungstate transport system ATP-binding protein